MKPHRVEGSIVKLLALSRRQREISRKHVIQALAVGLQAVYPTTLVSRHVKLRGSQLLVGSRSFELSRRGRLLVIGAGKAAGGMAVALEGILGERITGGLVIVPSYSTLASKTGRVQFHRATHPLPTIKGVRGVRKMLALVGRPTREDLAICVMSGGGSALMPLPAEGLSIDEKSRVTKLLLVSGAKIDEVNAVRKHLSMIKGGRLAQQLFPASVIGLIISDVASGRLGTVASGPLTPDNTTFAQARRVLLDYGIWARVPESVRRIIEKGVRGKLSETPKSGSPIFNRVHNFVLGSARDSCMAISRYLREKGYKPLILSTRLQGEARQVGNLIGSKLSNRSVAGLVRNTHFALVSAGETTVKVKGAGVGGRNQELVLSAALALQGRQNLALASIDSDGIDGPTPAAGALVDGNTIELADRQGLRLESFLERNDSYNFFRKLGGLIETGPTGTNVGDILVGLVRS